MDGLTRRALKVAIDGVRRELDDATDAKAVAARALGTLEQDDVLATAHSDDPEMERRLDGHRRNIERSREGAKKQLQHASDRIFEANLALSWLIEQALYAK